MGRMLAPLALQHGLRDLVERNAERAAVLRVAMPDRGHAAGHIDPVPCQTENVLLPQPDRKSTRLNYSHYCAPRMPSAAWKKIHTVTASQLLSSTNTPTRGNNSQSTVYTK